MTKGLMCTVADLRDSSRRIEEITLRDLNTETYIAARQYSHVWFMYPDGQVVSIKAPLHRYMVHVPPQSSYLVVAENHTEMAEIIARHLKLPPLQCARHSGKNVLEGAGDDCTIYAAFERMPDDVTATKGSTKL